MASQLSPEVQEYVLTQNKLSYQTYGVLDELHRRICNAYLELGNRFSWYDSRQERPKEAAHNRINNIMSTEERARKLWATMPINVLFSKMMMELRLQLTKMEDELKQRTTSEDVRTVLWDTHEDLKRTSAAALEAVQQSLQTRTAEASTLRSRVASLEEELASVRREALETKSKFEQELLVANENFDDQHRQFSQLLKQRQESDKKERQVFVEGMDAIQDVIFKEHERLQNMVVPSVEASKSEVARLKEDVSILQTQVSFLRRENSLLKNQVTEAKIGYDSYRTDPRLLKAKDLEVLLKKARDNSAKKDSKIQELERVVQKLEYHTRRKTEELEEANMYIEQHNVARVSDPQVLLQLHHKLASSLSSSSNSLNLFHTAKPGGAAPLAVTQSGKNVNSKESDKKQLLDDTSGFVSKYRRMKLARKISGGDDSVRQSSLQIRKVDNAKAPLLL